MRLAELLCPVAAATDASAALPPDTALRTALIAVNLGRALGFSSTAQSDLLFAGLVRHLGCSATSHEETRLAGDDQELRHIMAGVDKASPLKVLATIGSGLGRNRPLLVRSRRVAEFLVQGPGAGPRIFAARCEVSVALGRRLGLSEAAVRALDEAYERQDGKGTHGRRGEQLSPLTGVLAVAELVATLMRLPGGEELAFEALERRSGGELDPGVVRALTRASEEILAPARLEAPLGALLEAEPAPHRRVDDLRPIAQVLADFADLKSTFTLGHSRHVAALARCAAEALGLPSSEVQNVELAGWLHDLGRVSVSNAIWDKPGPLDPGEWDKVHAHAQSTERMLRATTHFADVARLAAGDHERLDGSGYPRGVAPTGAARIIAAADLVQSLLEARPYRPACSPDRAAAIAVAEVAAGRLDRATVNAVLESLGQTRARAPAPQGLTDRELDVLRLLARGLVDKEIAATLGISHRTVHHHNQSIFGKLNVSTRGAAALFAIEQGLL